MVTSLALGQLCNSNTNEITSLHKKLSWLLVQSDYWLTKPTIPKLSLLVQSDSWLATSTSPHKKHQLYKLEPPPNSDRRCKTPWLRSLLLWGLIDLDVQGQIELRNENFILPGPSITLNTQPPKLATRMPHVPRLFHSPDCFMISILFMYTDLGSQGYFSV